MKKILLIVLLINATQICSMGYHEGELEGYDAVWQVDQARRDEARKYEAHLEPNPFIKAVILNDLTRVKEMLTQNPDYANTQTSRGSTALKLAIENKNEEMVKVLLASKAFPDDEAFRSAVINGALSIVKLLVEAGGNPKSKDANGQTPEELARILDYRSMANYLANAGRLNNKI